MNIFIVSESHMTYRALCRVCRNVKGIFHLLQTFARILKLWLSKTALKNPTGTEVDDYLLRAAVQNAGFSCYFWHRLGASEDDYRPLRDSSPRVLIRMMDNLRLIHITADQC